MGYASGFVFLSMLPEGLLELYLKNRSVCTDTRKIKSGDLFFALKGPHFDANAFAEKALADGAIAAVVDDDALLGEPGMIVVHDVLRILQELAKAYRKELKIPFIGITGSNGKTTTKELVRDVLKQKYRVFATPGNLNNHIGVPLSILMIPQDCEIAVIELGANHIGEIEELCSISDPDFGLITNAGKDHLEGFGNVEGVRIALNEINNHLREKDGLAFVNAYLQDMVDLAKGLKTILFGPKDTEIGVWLNSNHKTINVAWNCEGKDQKPIATKLAGAYNLHNVACAIAVGLHFDINSDQIVNAIELYTPGNNRSQWVNTGKNEIILDAYNANPSSMEEALRNLAAQPGVSAFFMIGDMLEMGDAEAIEHIGILDLCEKLGLKGCTVGQAFKSASSKFNFQAFMNVQEARNYFKEHPIIGSLILLKGSRGIRMEEMMEVL